MTDQTKTDESSSTLRVGEAEHFPYHVSVSVKRVVPAHSNMVVNAKDENHAIEQANEIIKSYPGIDSVEILNCYRFDDSPKAKKIHDLFKEFEDKYGISAGELLVDDPIETEETTEKKVIN